MKKRLFSLLLALVMLLSLAPGARAESCRATSVDSAVAMSEALQARRGTGGENARVLLLADALADDCGAVRAIRWADMHQYVLEYADRAAAERALETLQAEYGADHCWLDTPDQGAAVLAERALPWNAEAMELDHMLDDENIRAHCADRTVKIAVLDTGADMSVSVLKARGISPDSYDFVNATSVMSDIPSGSAAGHGTTIATLLCSLLPENAELMLLRVFDDSGSASRTMVRTALNYALEHGADVINLSLGWEGADSTYTFLNDVLNDAQAQGVGVICAAGNKGRNVQTCYPANHEKTIAVSAIGKDLSYQSYSNYGTGVDFTAPGSDIVSVAPGDKLVQCKGTSFAAPHLTAAAAELLLAEDLDPQALYAALRGCAEDLGDEGRDTLYGWGLPQIAGYLDAHVTHRWGDWVVTTPATATAEGMETRTCTACGETETRPIPKLTGWQLVDSKWYFYENGAAATGWKKINNVWYYFNDAGVMQTGWQKVDGVWYYFVPSGAMVVGWQKISNVWYYFAPGGQMQTGWREIGGVWYYLKPSGAMAAREWCGGWWLNADGSWTYPYKGSWKQNSTGWWFGDESGWYACSTTVKINDKLYTFDARGYLA